MNQAEYLRTEKYVQETLAPFHLSPLHSDVPLKTPKCNHTEISC